MRKATTVDIKVFGVAEPAVSIIAASIPILRTLVQKKTPTTQERSIQFVQFSKIPEPGSRSLHSTNKGSEEGLVDYPSVQSHIVAGGQRI